MISGLSHMTFMVKDLDRAAEFWGKILGAKEVYSREANSSPTVKYFLLNDLWIALNKGEPLPERTYNHIAFAISDSDFDMYIARIQDVGTEIDPGRTRRDGEGRSIYFYDFDNHMFELHTGSLVERMTHYSKTADSRWPT